MPPLVLSDVDFQQLQSITNSRSLPYSIVQRAQIVLACGAGETNTAIAKRMGLTGMTVGNRCAEAKGYGVDAENGLIHSVQTTAANVHDLTPAA